MDFPDEETAKQRLRNQNLFTEQQIQEMCDASDILLTFEDIEFNKDVKLPNIYKHLSQNEKHKMMIDIFKFELNEYLQNVPKELHQKYIDSVKEETRVIINTGMVDYFLIDYAIVKEAVANGGIITKTGRGCFTKDALIWTKNNLKTIDNIIVGDMVLGDDNQFHKVLNTFEYEIEEDLVEFKYQLQGSSYKKYKNICTLDHKILVNRDNNIQYIQAKELKLGDLLCSPKIKNNFKNQEDIIIDLNDYNNFGFEYDDKYIYEEIRTNKEYKYSPRWFEKNNIVNNSSVKKVINGHGTAGTIKKILDNSPFNTIDNYIKYSKLKQKTKRKIPRFIKLNYLMNCFIGMMYGDGWTDKNYGLGIAINNTTKYNKNYYIIQKISNIFNLEITENKSKNKNLIQLYMNSKILNNWFRTDYFESKKGKTKIFNENLLNQSDINLKYLLLGLIITDGSRCKINQLSFDNTSLSICSAFKYLSNVIGYEPQSLDVRLKYVDKRGYNNSESYKLRIMENRKNNNIISDDNYWYLPITEIENHFNQKTTVYDFEVDNAHSYTINNIIVHNSGASYFINKLFGFSDIDRLSSSVHLYPSRFISETRILETKSLPDLDLNVGNPEIFEQAQIKVLGEGHCFPMIAFGTAKGKAAWKLYAKANDVDFEIANEISQSLERYETDLNYADDDDKDLIDIKDYIDEKYLDLFNESKMFQSIITDKKKHPCGYLLYDGDIRSEIGLIKCKSESTKKEYLTTVIDGTIAENYKFLKNDILKVDVWYLIDKIYKRIGIKIPSIIELEKLVKENPQVWDIYADGLTIGVNQVEKKSTTNKVMRYKPKNISELTAFVAAIRPAFQSMYYQFERREDFSYGINAFDKLIQTDEFPYSYILYQEQIMATLGHAGFQQDITYQIIKDIGKKHPEKVKPLKNQFLKGFTERLMEEDSTTKEEAEKFADSVWTIIDDSCAYGFNASHALCVAYDSLYCAYLKKMYPYEFYEVLLNEFSLKGKKDKVSLLKQEMKAFGIYEGDFKLGTDNRDFVANQKNNAIEPSLVSLKGVSKTTANNLYKAGKKITNENIFEVFNILKEYKVQKNVIIDLIKLNYFSDYGNISKVQKCFEIEQLFLSSSEYRKSISKADEDFYPYLDIIVKHSSRVTDKQYNDLDIKSILNDIYLSLGEEKTSISEKLFYEFDLLGYNKTFNDKINEDIYFVQEILQPYSAYILTLYNLKTQEIKNIKLYQKTFKESKIQQYDIIELMDIGLRNKRRKVNDEWIELDEKEEILESYKIIQRL